MNWRQQCCLSNAVTSGVYSVPEVLPALEHEPLTEENERTSKIVPVQDLFSLMVHVF